MTDVHEIGVSAYCAEWRVHEATACMSLRIGYKDSEQGFYLKPSDAAALAAWITNTVSMVKA
jgi:hypothetical protein